MSTIPPFLHAIIDDANRVAPGRNKATDGILPDARHLAQGVASDHNPDARGICHAVDVTNDPAHGMNTWAWGQIIADRIKSGAETRVKYVVSNNGTVDVIFNPSISMVWRQNGSPKQEHRSHLHTSILSTPEAENSTAPYFVGSSSPTPPPPEEEHMAKTFAASDNGQPQEYYWDGTFALPVDDEAEKQVYVDMGIVKEIAAQKIPQAMLAAAYQRAVKLGLI
jgi:hypothetical protein